jgi:hypothetical protein
MPFPVQVPRVFHLISVSVASITLIVVRQLDRVPHILVSAKTAKKNSEEVLFVERARSLNQRTHLSPPPPQKKWKRLQMFFLQTKVKQHIQETIARNVAPPFFCQI